MSTNLPFSNPRQFREYLVALWHQPPLNRYTPKIDAFWLKHGYRLKLSVGILALTLVLFLGLNLGRSLFLRFRPTQPTPPPLPQITLSPSVTSSSPLRDLRDQLLLFSPLLPDPAPPAVDENINLEIPID